jgi:thioredoxin reductase (NADPH)
VKVDASCATNIPGVFAAGDMIGGTIQLPNATGEGTTAALSAASYLAKLNKAEI